MRPFTSSSDTGPVFYASDPMLKKHQRIGQFLVHPAELLRISLSCESIDDDGGEHVPQLASAETKGTCKLGCKTGSRRARETEPSEIFSAMSQNDRDHKDTEDEERSVQVAACNRDFESGKQETLPL